MNRRKNADVLFYALQCAKSDRLSLIDAYSHMPKCAEIKNAERDIKAFTRLQKKIFGSTRSEMDRLFDGGESLTFAEIKRRIEDPLQNQESER